MTMLAKSSESKETLLHNALNQATDAKNLLLNQLIESEIQLESQKSKSKIPMFSSNLSAAGEICLRILLYKNNLSKYQIIRNKEKMSDQNDSANKAVCFNLTFFY